MATITWLHLSDFHFRSDERQRWDENIVLHALLSDVQERIVSDGLRPDFAVVSGDIAFSGQQDEYILAGHFFDDLLQVTGLSKSRLLVVPGNHDVNRKAISRGTRTITDALDSREKMAEVLTDENDRRALLRKLDPYARFLTDYFAGQLLFDDERYFYVRDLEAAGQKVAVLGLNSAWLSLGKTDYGRLALGERQVRGALEASQLADVRIALMHHPFDWLWEYDREDCEGLLLEGCDFILHGHLHRAGLLSLQTPDSGAVVVAAGASYEARQYPNGYNFVRLDPGARAKERSICGHTATGAAGSGLKMSKPTRTSRMEFTALTGRPSHRDRRLPAERSRRHRQLRRPSSKSAISAACRWSVIYCP